MTVSICLSIRLSPRSYSNHGAVATKGVTGVCCPVNNFSPHELYASSGPYWWHG